MSLILDALKKSESERQRQSSPRLVDVPINRASRRTPAWVWLVVVLLLVNIAILFNYYVQPEDKAKPVESFPELTGSNNDLKNDIASASEQVATKTEFVTPEMGNALSVQNERLESAETAEKNSSNMLPNETSIKPEASISSLDNADYPSFSDLIEDGSLQLADLHIDIHVYSSVPDERFVFINMKKYREGDQLAEGPHVFEIVSDGVVLDYLGVRFTLKYEVPPP